MNRLAFFQTDKKIIVGLLCKNQLFWKIENITSSTQNEKLLHTIQHVIEESNVKKIDAIITTKGPGSFTSIRILLSAAMGLSMGYDCPCYLPTVFDLLAYNRKNPFYITIDSKRGTIYTLAVRETLNIENVQELTPETLNIFRNQHDNLDELNMDTDNTNDEYYIELLKNLCTLSKNPSFVSQDFEPLYVSPLMYKKIHEQC
ncbi:MAG: hypothetical protein C0432_00460 [Candidatus Puniceispirillum sp.]|nr:hypothetical protein [Candidatus Pelagibacter sp.]MBA4282755.1 hypothetical protein [Candidatus Puniceispirillum sp.]